MTGTEVPLLARGVLPQLRTWLDDPGLEMGRVESTANGFSAQTIIAEVGASDGTRRDVALRFEHPGMEIFLDTDIALQAEVAKGLARHGVPAPRIIGVDCKGAVSGRRFMAMERAPGRGFPQAPSYLVAGWVKALAPEGRRQVWVNALSMLGRIGRIDGARDFTFLDRPPYGATGIDQYLGWLRAWRNDVLGTERHAIIDAGLDYLEADPPRGLPTSLVWGDSNPGNMLFMEDLRIGAVLDFEAAALGPAEIDLGWWLFLDRRRSSGHPPMPGKPDRAECIAITEQELGRPMRAMDYFEIMGGVRMSLVVARTIARLKQRGALDPDNDAAMYNPIAGMLAQLLGLTPPEAGDGFRRFVAAASGR